MSVNVRTPTTYFSDYERSDLPLQQRSINHPQSLKCEGTVPLRKSCLSGLVFCTIYLFSEHSTSTMAAAGPAHGKLVPNMVDQ